MITINITYNRNLIHYILILKRQEKHLKYNFLIFFQYFFLDHSVSTIINFCIYLGNSLYTLYYLHIFNKNVRVAAIFTTSKNTAVVFLAKSVKKQVCFCQFHYEVYNWQYVILHWQNYTYYTVIFTVHCHFHTYEI